MSSRTLRGLLEAALLTLLVASLSWRLMSDRTGGPVTSPIPRDSVATLLEKGNAAYERTDLASAAVFYADVLKKDPKNVPARIRLASIFHKNAWSDNAVAMLDQVLREVPDNPDARLLKARIYRDEGDSELAVKEYEEVLARFPGNAEALYYLGTAYQADRQFENAIRTFQKTIATDPDLVLPPFETAPFGILARDQLGRAYRQLANLNFQARRNADGLELLDLAIDTFRDAAAAVDRIGLKNFREAHNELINALVQKANLLRRAAADERQVLAIYEEIIRIDPEDVGAWFEAGQIRYRLARTRKDLEKARTYFKKAFELDPRDLDIQTNLTAIEQDLARPDAELEKMLRDE